MGRWRAFRLTDLAVEPMARRGEPKKIEALMIDDTNLEYNLVGSFLQTIAILVRLPVNPVISMIPS